MSIADDLSRIQVAKVNLRSSIEAQGVPMPESALIDAYPGYVDQISGGYDTPLTIMECDEQGYVTQVDATKLDAVPDYMFGVTTTATPGPFAHLKLLRLNENTQSIGTGAARYCSEMDLDIDHLNACTSIGERAFQGCGALSSLRELMNPDMLVGVYAFNGCTSLSTLKIKVGRIGTTYSSATNSFTACTGLIYMWMSKETGRIWATTETTGPFANGNPGMVIYTDVVDVSSIPSTWGQYWNYFGAGVEYATVYGTSESEFDAIVAGVEPTAGPAVQLLSDDVLMAQALETLGVTAYEDV